MLATTRKVSLIRSLGRASRHGSYIGLVTRARPTFKKLDQIDSQGRIRHLATTSTSKLAKYSSNAYLDFRFSTDPVMASLKPPQLPPTWQHTVEDIERLTTEALAKDKKISDDIVQLSEDQLGFDNVFLALANTEAAFDIAIEPLSFYQNVSTDKAIRDASTKSEERARKYANQESMREDLYKAKVTAAANLRKTGAWDALSAEQKRLVDKMLLDGKRAGLGVESKEEREKLKRLKDDLSDACLKFTQNFNEENGRISFTREQLDGVPEDVISGYTQRTEGDKVLYEVTFKTPDIFPVFKYANDPKTREAAQQAFDDRLANNVGYLDTALRLRKQIAEILQYDSWADYITEVKMVKSAANAKKFLDDLKAHLDPLGTQERATLLGLKKEARPFRNLFLTVFRLIEYFPVSVVVPAILDIYQNLLGVKFVEITGDARDVWHPEVQQFAVWEMDAKDESGFIGYCYLDLFPREGKYSHAAVWGLLPGYELPEGKRHLPLTAMVANLAKPTPERPALMRHDDVTTFFHEMGHVFHGLLSRTKYSRFHGTAVARDFVEAPSQMLENWCWEPEVLKKMSSHYKTQEPLSDDLIAKIIKSRYVNVGLFYLRQLFFANFDLAVHNNSLDVNTDYTKLWNELREKISLVQGSEDKPGQGTFGHIVGGYDAGYYGYTYSLVFAADMYATVFKKAPLDPALGKLYRDKILFVGGSRDDMDSLKDFLGREPDPKAFINEIEQDGNGDTARASNL
ncbi:mitochondrial endopeptidase [Boletus edulis BED1]|uniref:Mitochondrial endopeptidase n=1 Tax=Boletus edulis BED1 TaxID=1328754 RepID=A0AAD4C968_BOLED|nr:mitochondrial endopeptidase [Boletus edulis BED1]